MLSTDTAGGLEDSPPPTAAQPATISAPSGRTAAMAARRALARVRDTGSSPADLVDVCGDRVVVAGGDEERIGTGPERLERRVVAAVDDLGRRPIAGLDAVIAADA